MNSNIILKDINEIANVLTTLEAQDGFKFLQEILSPSEIETLSKRWRILEMLKEGCTQREIAKDLQVSLCKVTRGAKIMKDKNSILAKYLSL